MQLSFSRTELAQTAVITVMTVAALALLAAVGAYWTWQWFAPRPEPRAPVQAEINNQISTALDMFGTAQRDVTMPEQTGLAIRLLGVVAATQGREAFAVLMLDGKQVVATRAGEEIAPGIKLSEVAANNVVLDRNGARESLAWPEKSPVPDSSGTRVRR
jgi:general secretion pathway protein C